MYCISPARTMVMSAEQLALSTPILSPAPAPGLHYVGTSGEVAPYGQRLHTNYKKAWPVEFRDAPAPGPL